MGRRFYGFNNRFRTTKNGEAVVFENGGVNTANLANYGTRRKSKRINKMVYGYLRY